MADGNLTMKEFWQLTVEERCERYKDLSDHDKFGVRQGDPGVVSVPCNECIHYLGYAKCRAFPDGISAEHIQAVEDDLTTLCGSGFKYKKNTD